MGLKTSASVAMLYTGEESAWQASSRRLSRPQIEYFGGLHASHEAFSIKVKPALFSAGFK
jgi:hypothetical protein